MGGRLTAVMIGAVLLGGGVGGIVAEVSYQAEQAPFAGIVAGFGLGFVLCAFVRD